MVLIMRMRFRGGEPTDEMWEGPDRESLLAEMRWAARGVDGQVTIHDRAGNKIK
jgi:hypothetical protein